MHGMQVRNGTEISRENAADQNEERSPANHILVSGINNDVRFNDLKAAAKPSTPIESG